MSTGLRPRNPNLAYCSQRSWEPGRPAFPGGRLSVVLFFPCPHQLREDRWKPNSGTGSDCPRSRACQGPCPLQASQTDRGAQPFPLSPDEASGSFSTQVSGNDRPSPSRAGSLRRLSPVGRRGIRSYGASTLELRRAGFNPHAVAVQSRSGR